MSRARPRRPSAARSRPRSDGLDLPDAFVQQARAWLGAEAEAFLDAVARPSGLAIRANGLKGGLAHLQEALGSADGSWPRVPWWPHALLPPTDEATRLAAHPLAAIGALYAQDPAALAAVAVLDPRPGERVLDLCAAPGGKSTAIADRMAGQGLLVANDVDGRRARELGRTLERWGAPHVAVLSQPAERLAGLVPRLFDRVLVDAPCSGESMFARHPRAAADWSPAHVAGCAARQRRLLPMARRLVRPGGLLVYATCTFNPLENEDVVARYLVAFPADTLVDAASQLPGWAAGRPDLVSAGLHGPRLDELARCARLWPHHAPGAGHFIACIRLGDGDDGGSGDGPHPASMGERRARRGGTGGRPLQADTDAADVRALVNSVAPRFSLDGRIVVRGDVAYLVSIGLPDGLAQAAFVPGLRLAERRGRTWRPAHALAMALSPEEATASATPTDGALAGFLGGRPVTMPVIPSNRAGLYLAAWRGYPLGWARSRAGELVPLLPKGLQRPVAEE